ncbi:hypothetical protein [Actinoplanes derwentensis]|uniref:Uncharacterized protein n=1 Tax=Actinoplanes derwentensis TaxID=113562 RepID=A0A1H1R2E1_9ACTN|nr:hypothetical protein [Actinoplanes derwentensis]GID90504.1 hypothetical protein Ade03nite_94280 [Actinoplanes derwentensis]SDS29790.1 hypothetical protein SAMN04489716_0473 [Actinoplanes derwentensis]
MTDNDSVAASPETAGANGTNGTNQCGPGGWAGFRAGAALGIALLAGFVAGRTVDSPAPPVPPVASAGPVPDSVFYVTGAPVHQHGTASGAADPAGLARTAYGLTLAPEATAFEAGRPRPLRFRILAAGGAPVTAYTKVHDSLLHLIVIRRDLTGFQHLHPAMAPDGIWNTDLTLPGPGGYRAIADFTAVVGGQPLPVTLGVDLTVAGEQLQDPLPPPAPQVETGHLTVQLDGSPTAGSEGPVTVRVSDPAGTPTRLEPYLGAAAHLVAFSEGDVAYLHTHAEPDPAAGTARFRWTPPGPGRYRLFAEFRVSSTVHVAAFTVDVH